MRRARGCVLGATIVMVVLFPHRLMLRPPFPEMGKRMDRIFNLLAVNAVLKYYVKQYI
jgi:hypothetical protein